MASSERRDVKIVARLPRFLDTAASFRITWIPENGFGNGGRFCVTDVLRRLVSRLLLREKSHHGYDNASEIYISAREFHDLAARIRNAPFRVDTELEKRVCRIPRISISRMARVPADRKRPA